MTPSHPGPLVRRRQLGTALRRHRIDAKLSVREVAQKLLCSESKISRIESAQRNISLRDVRDLMDLYRITDPETRGNLMRLAEESRESAWWSEFDLSPALERLIGLEGSATKISDYQIGVMPGLLQTREYAAAVSSTWIDDPEAIQNAVALRMARQKFLSRDTALRFIVDESVFHRPIGNPAIMREQVRKLLALTSEGSSSLELQMIPFSVGAHQGMVTGFIILQFTNSTQSTLSGGMSDVVYLEGALDTPTYLDQPDDVDGYLKVFEGLQRLALGRIETVSFLEALIRDL